ncbi:GALK Galactokinase, partial [Spelaeornis formosus]|nr:GALK Galactokinase [Elachura formosa]
LASSLSDVYTPAALEHEKQRWAELFDGFKKEFGAGAPQKVARAPGRVNIIGEHIDYCGFSVLPAAIERDVLIAFSTAEPDPSFAGADLPAPSQDSAKTVFVLRNVQSKFSPTDFEADLAGDGTDLALPSDHHWSSYFIAGTKGILAHLKKTGGISLPSPPKRVLILVGGTVPEGSGLSSSSAMTTASAIAILELVGRREGENQVARKALTNVAIESERLVGVNSGGMDQSASVFSRSKHLLHIEFIPQLNARAIPLPQTDPPFSFVIANTLVTSNKKVTAKYHYNLRVVECRLGALLLAKFLGLPYTYESRPKLVPKTASGSHELRTMIGLVGQALGGPGMEDGMTIEQVAERLECGTAILENAVMDREVEPKDGKFKLWTRARHVFSESLRVYEFKDLLCSTAATQALLEQMGNLMNESMESCQRDYECSCPELDELVALARSNGAYGSRVTGAGWGGATVSLVREPDVPNFIDVLRREYYGKRFPDLSEQELHDACFATKPEAGANVFAGE